MAFGVDNSGGSVALLIIDEIGEEVLADLRMVLDGERAAAHCGQDLIGAFKDALLFFTDEVDESLCLIPDQSFAGLARL